MWVSCQSEHETSSTHCLHFDLNECVLDIEQCTFSTLTITKKLPSTWPKSNLAFIYSVNEQISLI